MFFFLSSSLCSSNYPPPWVSGSFARFWVWLQRYARNPNDVAATHCRRSAPLHPRVPRRVPAGGAVFRLAGRHLERHTRSLGPALWQRGGRGAGRPPTRGGLLCDLLARDGGRTLRLALGPKRGVARLCENHAAPQADVRSDEPDEVAAARRSGNLLLVALVLVQGVRLHAQPARLQLELQLERRRRPPRIPQADLAAVRRGRHRRAGCRAQAAAHDQDPPLGGHGVAALGDDHRLWRVAHRAEAHVLRLLVHARLPRQRLPRPARHIARLVVDATPLPRLLRPLRGLLLLQLVPPPRLGRRQRRPRRPPLAGGPLPRLALAAGARRPHPDEVAQELQARHARGAQEAGRPPGAGGGQGGGRAGRARRSLPRLGGREEEVGAVRLPRPHGRPAPREHEGRRGGRGGR